MIPSSLMNNNNNRRANNEKKNLIKLKRWEILFVVIATYWAGISTGLLFCSYASLDEKVANTSPKIESLSVLRPENLGVEIKGAAATTTAAAAEQQALDRSAKKEGTTTNYNEAKQKSERKSKIPDSESDSGQSNEVSINKLKVSELKLPVPIIVMGLQKAGTTSIYSYFYCGLEDGKLSHYDCKPHATDKSFIGMACGKRLRRNVEKLNKPALTGLGDHDLYAELDAQENNGGMTLPQWTFVQEIHDHYPNATWILNLRDPHAWLRSIDRWQDLRQRFVDIHLGPQFWRGRGEKDDEMIDFYNLQAQRIRDFVKDHPSHTLVEVHIDDQNAGQVMEDAFGITQNCWGKRNVFNGSAIWTPV